MLNGNIGVIKSMIAGTNAFPHACLVKTDTHDVMTDLTDPSNIAQGFAMMPVMWSVGGTIGCATSRLLLLEDADAK